MQMIEIAALENGAHNNQTYHGFLPEGWAIIPDGLEIPDTFPFVDITVEDFEGRAVVATMEAGVVPEPEVAVPAEGLTAEQQIAALTARVEELEQKLKEKEETV